MRLTFFYCLLLGICFCSFLGLSSCQKSEKKQAPAATEGRPKPREKPRPVPKGPPNIVLMMADDMGYGDIGCYCSEIATPHLDSLAAAGVRCSQFYNAARCCPSGASLLTGLYPHQSGLGRMINRRGKWHVPGPYQSFLDEKAVTMAQLLKKGGYNTYMAGKWHLNEKDGSRPLDRGFQRFFGLLDGASSYYGHLKDRSILVNEKKYQVPEDFFFTRPLSDTAAAYVRQGAASQRPFFLYLAFKAPHWPIQAPQKPGKNTWANTAKAGKPCAKSVTRAC